MPQRTLRTEFFIKKIFRPFENLFTRIGLVDQVAEHLFDGGFSKQNDNLARKPERHAKLRVCPDQTQTHQLRDTLLRARF